MAGYFVWTRQPTTEEEKALHTQLTASKILANLDNTRTFNKFTGRRYAKQINSAVAHNRNNTEEQRAKRKLYNSKPEVKEKMRLYNRSEKAREKKRKYRERRKKLLEMVPPEILSKVLEEEMQAETANLTTTSST